MTWEEITKKYEAEKRGERASEKRPKLEKNWDNLVKSTDKLVWLFMFSNGRGQVKAD
ncbi:MAG: hypothetical protein NTY45_05470 [Elusimicrobia bacterium]|nr:hypothetical protein [Elusimicrobiota bacterium]